MSAHTLPLAGAVAPRPAIIRMSRRLVVVVVAAALLLIAIENFRSFSIPGPTGVYAVGRDRIFWNDTSRPEIHTADELDSRRVAGIVWYPAKHGSGQSTSYIDNLAKIRSALIESGEFSALTAFGLGLIRDSAINNGSAAESESGSGFPLLILSPGNQTNVVFYSALAEDLASKGFIVVGIDHPYQVAAVELDDGVVAGYDHSQDTERFASVEQKVSERVADINFVIDSVLTGPSEPAFQYLDRSRVGVLGHSLGGLAAVEVCRDQARVAGCVNIDGQAAGGPLGALVDSTVPTQPFMYLTKEEMIHPEIAERFESGGVGKSLVVVPEAAHDDFSDGGLVKPRLNPFDRSVREVVDASRAFIGLFFEQAFAGVETWAFDGVTSDTDMYVNLFPLGDRPVIPSR